MLAHHLTVWKKRRRPTTVLHGRNSDGQWKTAQAKEHPRRLSAAIAHAMLDAATTPIISRSEKYVESQLESLSRFQPILDRHATSEQQFGTDFVDSPDPVGRFLWLGTQ